ncbi:MAG: YeeE/YedE family protein [Candidatus Rokubacteria bacterium]|nr:YeeE/YedE family protein [Candidatus Rokubacteria bacterium]
MRIFREQYDALFARPWPVVGAAVLIAVTNVFLFAFDRPFTASDGVRNWGDWMLTGAGVLSRPDLIAPWLYSGSMLNLGVIAGALAAALLSREFAIRVPVRGELVKGALGGAMLGIGAMLALGCNIGGFFSAVSALSLSGLGMMLGLLAGAIVGLRYLVWELHRHPAWSAGRSVVFLASTRRTATQPWLGVLVVALVLVLPFVYAQVGHGPRGLFLVFGAVFGFIFQRSRLCLVRAFREPFMTGDGEHTRASAIAVVVAMLGFAILKFTDLKDRGEWVFPAAGAGALLGGLIFGIGMVLAGGCGSGSIWRVGEGQMKLVAAVVTFALGASLTRIALTATGLQQKLGVAVFLPAWLGWAGAIFLVIGVMAAWAAFATWNEATERFSLGS